MIERLDKVGGIYNAFTGEEFTGYFAKVEDSHLTLALDWVSDIYLNSTFPQKEIEKERRVIIEEINMYFDTPVKYIWELWKDVLYGDQPAGWDIAGNKETIAKISRQQILEYRKSHYAAQNTIVCVAGKFEEDKILDKIKNYFSKISTLKFAQKPKVIEKQMFPGCLVHFKKTDQTHFCLGVRAYNIFHPQRYVLDVLSAILGEPGMMSSRIFSEVREKLGLGYYIKTETNEDPDAGYLVTSAGVDNNRVEKAITVILNEYRKISQKKVPLEELKKAKENIKGKLALSLESSDAKAFFYAGQEILENRILKLEEIFKKIDKVTQNDILKVARDIFRPEKLNFALIGPFEDKTKFEKLLKI